MDNMKTMGRAMYVLFKSIGMGMVYKRLVMANIVVSINVAKMVNPAEQCCGKDNTSLCYLSVDEFKAIFFIK
jgi:hypothetical protein